MSRISTVQGEIVTEIVSPRVEINWDPVTNGGTTTWSLAKLVTINDQFVSLVPVMGLMTVDLATLLPRSFPVVIGKNADGTDQVTDVPFLLLMGAVKTVFDTCYNEQGPDGQLTIPVAPPPQEPLPDSERASTV